MCYAVVVSFTFGVKVQGDTIQKPGLAAPGLMLLIGGIAGIALNGEVVARRRQNEGTQRESPIKAFVKEIHRRGLTCLCYLKCSINRYASLLNHVHYPQRL